jgi:hypothetical protein
MEYIRFNLEHLMGWEANYCPRDRARPTVFLAEKVCRALSSSLCHASVKYYTLESGAWMVESSGALAICFSPGLDIGTESPIFER